MFNVQDNRNTEGNFKLEHRLQSGHVSKTALKSPMPKQTFSTDQGKDMKKTRVSLVSPVQPKTTKFQGHNNVNTSSFVVVVVIIVIIIIIIILQLLTPWCNFHFLMFLSHCLHAVIDPPPLLLLRF